MFDKDKHILLPQLGDVGSSLKGTASWVTDAILDLRGVANSRKLGPNKTDFRQLCYIVGVLSDELSTAGSALQLYDRFLKEQGLWESYQQYVTKSQFDN